MWLEIWKIPGKGILNAVLTFHYLNPVISEELCLPMYQFSRNAGIQQLPQKPLTLAACLWILIKQEMPLMHWNSTSRISLLYSFDVSHPIWDECPHVLLRRLEENRSGLFTVGKHFLGSFIPEAFGCLYKLFAQTTSTVGLCSTEQLQGCAQPGCTQQRCAEWESWHRNQGMMGKIKLLQVW